MKRLIFVVDDQAVVADTMAMILNTTGEFRALCHYTVGDAVEACKQTRPELVLLDVRMPGTDGLEHAVRMRDRLGCRVLLFSGSLHTAGLIEAATSQGLAPFRVLPKPYPPGDLIAEIRGILAESASPGSALAGAADLPYPAAAMKE